MARCPRCTWLVAHAGQYCCHLGHGLTAAQARALWATPAVRTAEAAMDAAALAGDVLLTKAQCRRWWLATLDVLLTLAATDQALAHRRAGWATARDAITAHCATTQEEGVTICVTRCTTIRRAKSMSAAFVP